MLRIRVSPSAKQAEEYALAALSQEGYYTQSQEMAGRWGGQGAARLGLRGRVDREAFHLLCHNINPATKEPLTPRTKANRRVGYDFNFNAPKSVSLAYEYTGDERILKTFLRAERETMEEIEREASTRVRIGGEDEDRPTRALVWGDVVHFTARPKDGIPDPHLHSHVFVFNATFDEVEGRWKAVQLGEVKANAAYYEAAFHARFAQYLREAGYKIEPHGRFFEIAGVPATAKDKFSNRTKIIQAEARRRGYTTAAEKDGLAALTREKKAKDLTKSELHALWWARLTPEEKTALEGLKTRLTRSPEPVLTPEAPLARSKEFLGRSGAALEVLRVAPQNDREAVAFALEHIFERASVVSEKDLLAEALQWGFGRATVEGVKAAVKAFPLIRVERAGRTLLTTAEVLAEEQRIVSRCLQGKGKLRALDPAWRIQDESLNPQQREAVLHVLRSRDFITGISGKAGTGKTTLLREAAQGIAWGMDKLCVFAPTSEAARDVLRKEGFANAETVAKLLASEALQEQARGAVWWVDEAGLLSSHAMDKLLALAETLAARVVLVGDTGQHHAVERGQAFELLQKFGNMAVASVEQIQRQKGAYKHAVEQIAEKDFAGAFQTFEAMGAFREIPELGDRQNALAADYVAAVGEGKSALVVSPTHAEREAVTQAIRHTLKEKGVLGEGQARRVLRNLSWTAAQKRDVRRYEPGMIAQVTQPIKGLALGEQLEVVALKHEAVRVQRKNGDLKNLPTWEPDTFNVFERQSMEVCPGDRLRVTANSRSADGHRLNNGKLFTVDCIDPEGTIVLENGWRLGKDFGHLDYGYATTSHASQGKTVDRVLVAQSGLLSSGGSDAQQFYVSVSRGRECVHIYTDDIEALREHVARVRERPMAMEVVPEGEREKTAAEKPERAVKAAPEPKASRELGRTAGESETLQALIEEIASAVAEREKEMGPEKVQEREQAPEAVPQVAREPEREVVMEM